MDITVYNTKENNSDLIPNPLRALLVGSSGSGKTNLLLNLILKENGIKFKHLFVFSKSIEQNAYSDLRKSYEQIERKTKKTIAHFFNNCDDLISLDECPEKSLVVFDDCLMDKQDKIKDYFIRSRHKNISCVYLTQSFTKVDLQVIRNNINFICVFNQNEHYTKRIYQEFVGSDMVFNRFQEICRECWSIPHGFITIDMTKKSHSGKYKCALNKTVNTNR